MPKKLAPAQWLVLQELKKSLQQLLAGRERKMLLAVSGGADSLALAHAAAQLRQELDYSLRVCHVEHGLRGQEALEDAELVRRFCQQHKLEFVCCSVKVKAYCQATGCSLEEGARLLRYEALAEQAKKFGAALVLTAHHRDDQVETFLLKLLRGAGPEGLRGMTLLSKRDSISIGRPFLGLSRGDLEEYCRLEAIEYCQDSTNQDCSYTRNRIRLQLLPQLEQEYNKGLRAGILHTMELLAEQEDFLKEEEDRCWNSLQDIEIETQRISLKAGALKVLKPVLRKRILRRAYFALGGKELSLERSQAVEKLLLTGVGGKIVQLPESVTVSLAKGRLVFQVEEREK